MKSYKWVKYDENDKSTWPEPFKYIWLEYEFYQEAYSSYKTTYTAIAMANNANEIVGFDLHEIKFSDFWTRFIRWKYVKGPRG